MFLIHVFMIFSNKGLNFILNKGWQLLQIKKLGGIEATGSSKKNIGVTEILGQLN